MEQPEEFSVIQRFEDHTEAELACGLLVSAGLDARLEEHELLHGVSESLPVGGAVGLMVPPNQVSEARELLESARNSGGTKTSDMTGEDA